MTRLVRAGLLKLRTARVSYGLLVIAAATTALFASVSSRPLTLLAARGTVRQDVTRLHPRVEDGSQLPSRWRRGRRRIT